MDGEASEGTDGNYINATINNRILHYDIIDAKQTQESAFEELESALIADVLKNNSLSGSDSFTSNNRSPPSGRAQLTSSGSSRKK